MILQYFNGILLLTCDVKLQPFFRSKMSRAFNFGPIFNFFFNIKVHYILKSFAVRTFFSSIFVLTIFLLKVLKNWNFLYNIIKDAFLRSMRVRYTIKTKTLHDIKIVATFR